MFLNIDELKTVVLREVVDLITTSDDTIVNQIIAESIDLMKSYLNNYYDATAVFDQTGEDRSLIVLKYLKDIVVFEIYIRRTRDFNEVAKIRYDEAMLWLDKVAKGQINVDLPTNDSGDENGGGSDGYLHLGGKGKYKTGW